MLPLDLAESSNSKPATVRGSVQNIFRWVVGVVAVFKRPSKYISRPERQASDNTVESLADSTAEAAVVVPTATNSAVAKIDPNWGFTSPVTTEDKISEDARINPVARSYLISRKFSADATWLDHCSTTSGADPTTSLRHLLIGSTRLKLISTSD